MEIRIYNGAKNKKGTGFNGAFLYFTEDVQKAIGGNGRASVAVTEKKNLSPVQKTLTVFPDDTGKVISHTHKGRWKIYVSGKEGKLLQKYAKHIWSDVQIEDIHADVNVKLKKLVIKLDEYDKEEEKQEEIKIEPVEPHKYSVYDMGQALMHLLKVQDEMKIKLDELYRHRLDR